MRPLKKEERMTTLQYETERKWPKTSNVKL